MLLRLPYGTGTTLMGQKTNAEFAARKTRSPRSARR